MEKLKKYCEDNDLVSIIDIIQNKVIDIAKTEYESCYHNDLDFWVSRLFDGGKESIILTINHMGYCFSRVIYPRLDCTYGLESLKEIMESLYNQTM